MKKYLKLVNDLFFHFLKDLVSFRNKLVLVTCVICFIALKSKDPVIVTAALGCWTIILSYYFYSRNKSKEIELVNQRNEKNKTNEVSDC